VIHRQSLDNSVIIIFRKLRKFASAANASTVPVPVPLAGQELAVPIPRRRGLLVAVQRGMVRCKWLLGYLGLLWHVDLMLRA
jgi:hypothetical protein